ncbi:alkaline phosphatase [Thalassotalea montiporae]
MRKLLSSLCVLAACSAAAKEQPHNIIMVIADGMGPAYTTGYRYYNDDPNTKAVEPTIFDKYLVGMASTYPALVSGYVTDSAAGATALSAGIKTYNGAIGVDVNKQPVETVLERAKHYGMKTGAVVTSQVNHATPASYLAHNEYRRNYNEIADSYVDDRIKGKIKFDVLFGGGWQYFIRDDRQLVEELTSQGVQYIDAYQQLSDLHNKQPALGLFADVGLPHALDDTDRHRLSKMTKAATNLLANQDKGYFLLVEASQVDWAGHSNDISAAMAEMDDLAKTIEYLEGYVAKHPNTTVILTADHSTGGLTLAAHGEYKWQPDVLKKQLHSPAHIAKVLLEKSFTKQQADELFNLALTQAEYDALVKSKVDAEQQLTAYEQLSKPEQGKARKPNTTRLVAKTIKKLLDTRSNTGWTSGGHTAIDVPVIALGKYAEKFAGHQDNTQIAKKVFKLLDKYNKQRK